MLYIFGDYIHCDSLKVGISAIISLSVTCLSNVCINPPGNKYENKLGQLTKASCHIDATHTPGSGDSVNQCNSIRKSTLRHVQCFI